jgi:hypothetical protein
MYVLNFFVNFLYVCQFQTNWPLLHNIHSSWLLECSIPHSTFTSAALRKLLPNSSRIFLWTAGAQSGEGLGSCSPVGNGLFRSRNLDTFWGGDGQNENKTAARGQRKLKAQMLTPNLRKNVYSTLIVKT